MNILLLGQSNSVTHTILDMLGSVDEWVVEMTSSLSDILLSDGSFDEKTADYNIIVAHMGGIEESPNSVVQKITSKLPAVPLLVLHSYDKKFLINPLIESGASGYLQVGLSEAELLEAVRKVAGGKEYILTENTY